MKPEDIADEAIILIGYVAGTVGQHLRPNAKPDWKYLEKKFQEAIQKKTKILSDALREISMRSMYGGEENTDALPDMNRSIGELARKALKEAGIE